MAKVSVIVPIYNVEKYLDQCVNSLREQSLQDIEIILVDDGSPDGSGAICDRHAAQDSRIKVIHKPNGGVGAARNDGLAVATGDYVIFVDSDDYVPEAAYEKMYNCAVETGADIVIGDVYLVRGEQKEYAQFYQQAFVSADRSFLDKMIRADFYNTYCPDPANGKTAFGYGGPWNKLVRRSMLTEKGITFDLRVKGIFDDIIYTAFILAEAEKVAYITEPVYYYRLLNNSITQTYKANMPEINCAIFTVWQEFMEKYGSDDRFQKAFCANVVRRLETIIQRYYFSNNNPNPRTQMRKELKQLLKSEPYRTAIRNVELEKLASRHKLLVHAAKTGSISLIWLATIGKDYIKKLKNKR